MRLLHTSDWHLGRSLHGHDLLGAQAAFLDSLVEVVRAERVDAVLVAGDVHDRALPPVDAMRLLADALARLRDAGAAVVAISGNHDAPARLGDKSALLDPRIALRTDPARVGVPVVLEDASGPVALYGIPYLEPAAVRDALPGNEGEPDEARGDGSRGEGGLPGGAHTRVLARAMRAVRADQARRGGRSVVLAHAWVTGGEPSESERDIAVGGVAQVPASLFEGVDYTALGHLHRPQLVDERVRYSGSPLPYSFGEAAVPKQSWLVELGPDGAVRAEAVPTPVHRALTRLRGTLDELLTRPDLGRHEKDFVSVVLTDAVRPVDAMSALRRRFETPLALAWEPPAASDADDAAGYVARLRGRDELDVAVSFVEHVRSAAGERERVLLRDALEAARATEQLDRVGA